MTKEQVVAQLRVLVEEYDRLASLELISAKLIDDLRRERDAMVIALQEKNGELRCVLAKAERALTIARPSMVTALNLELADSTLADIREVLK